MPRAATVDRPAPPVEMGRIEAEAVTQAIKDNFDSLGAMLIQARDRKAYKALGYRTFEGYCKTEFGKSSSNAYRLIEDAKVVAQLEAEISKRYEEPVGLNIPSACLRPLKELPDIGEKLQAIDHAKKLATAEGKEATKKHLEIAVFEISGKRSEGFRSAIQSLGFKRGVSVEVTKSLKKDRGFVTKVDKLGKVHIQLYYGGADSIPFDAHDLRILTDAEKPAIPLNEITASKGDRVLIFAQGLEGKKGTIYTWKPSKQALVTVDGESSPIDIAYAEMELIRGEQEQKNTNWDSELVWNAGKNTYYYFPQEDTIYSNIWPQGLALKPHSHEKNPIEFIQNWEDKFAGNLLEALLTPAKIKTLALAQAIELPEDEAKEFVTDLIASLSQLLPQTSKPPKAMGISFSRTINELVSGKKTQTRRAWQDDYAKNFIRYFDESIAIPALNKGRHRGGHELGFIKLTQRPYQQYLSEMSPIDLQEEGGMVATAQEFIDTFFEGQDKLVWVLHFEFLSAPVNNNTDALIEENQRLREQLAEAEVAIETIVNAASAASALEPEQTAEFLVEDAASAASALEPELTAEFLVENTSTSLWEPQTWLEVLDLNSFTQGYIQLEQLNEESTEAYRGWNIYTYDSSVADISHPVKGIFSIDFSWAFEKEIINPLEWLKNIINQVEDFCPGQLSLELNTEVESFPQALLVAISNQEERLYEIIDKKKYEQQKGKLTKREADAISANRLQRLKDSLQELRDFQKLRIGQFVTKRFHPETKGRITGFELSVGGMPLIWVAWLQSEGGGRIAEHYPLKSIVVEI